MNPYVFIVGCPRSGTTLLKRMVDAHPEIAITPETNWVSRRLRDGRGIGPDGIVTEDLIEALVEYPRFARLGIAPEDLRPLLGGDVSYAEFVSAIYDLYGQKRGRSLVGDKTPSYVEEVALLAGLWPEARFVHIVRDGRDVCLSALSWAKSEHLARRFATWREDPVVTAALWWRRLVMLGREDGTVLTAGLYYELRYERLVTDPEPECRSLCSFLGLDYDAQMLHFHEDPNSPHTGLPPKKPRRPVTAGLRDWSSQLAPEDVEAFEAAAGDLLDTLGYERTAPHPGPRPRARAARVAEVYEKSIPRRMPHRLERS